MNNEKEITNYSADENDMNIKDDNNKSGDGHLDEARQEIKEEFNKVLNEGIKNINEQIDNANEKLNSSVNIYNSTLGDREKAISLYRESFSETAHNAYKKHSGQTQIEDEQLNLVTTQEISQNSLGDAKKQLGYLQSDLQESAKKEQNEEAQDEEAGEEDDVNPLTSLGYKKRLFEFFKRQSERYAQIMNRNAKEEQKKLQKVAKSFQKKQISQVKETQKKANRLASALNQITLKRKRYNDDIDRGYKRFDVINKKYKKILGLKEKYKDKINLTFDLEEQEDLVKKFKSDVYKMVRASASDVKEETDKFDDKGNRVETKKEKRDRKEKEKQDKEDAKKREQEEARQERIKYDNEIQNKVEDKEENLAKKLQDDKKNCGISRSNFYDEMLKNAHNNYLNKKNYELDDTKKMQINNVNDNDKNISSNINIPTIKAQGNDVCL